MDASLRKFFYNRCDPSVALAADQQDDRYVNLDELTPDGDTARGEDWLDLLVSRFEFEEQPNTVLFTGLPGSGKSTLLRYVAARLSRSDGASLLPVILDAEEYFDTRAEIDVTDVRCAVLVAIDKALRALEGAAGADALRESRFARFWQWFSGMEVSMKEVEVSGEPFGVGAKIVADMKASESIRAEARARVAKSPKTFLDKADAVIVEDFVPRAKALNYAGIFVVVDSLEKLRGVSSNWTKVLDSAEQMFAGGAPDLRLPVHTIYTLPPALILRLNARVEFLPLLKLVGRDGTRFDLGHRKARELVERRVPVTQLEALFGATWERRVDRLIGWSGGHPRQIMSLLQRFLLKAPPIPDAVFERVLGMEGDSYRRVITTSAHPWLAEVEVHHTLRLKTADERAIADEMFANSIVLRYFNGSEWYGLHPAVRDADGIREEIARLRNASP